jgi:dihydroflavonol-4-reductase
MDVVTGATGMLGNVLVRELVSRGRDVRVFVRKTSDMVCFNDCEVEKFYGDILDLDSLERAFKDAEIVYHLASEISIMPGLNKNLREVNLTGTKNVISACCQAGIKRLVYTSSIHAFKEVDNIPIIDESLPFDPSNPMGEYNRTKAMASLAVREAVKKGLLDAVIVCPTAVIGPYDFKVSNMGSLFIEYCNKKQKIIIDGAFDFVDVRDVAIGHMLAAEKGKSGETYILSGQRLTLAELMSLLEELTGIPAPKHRLPKWLAYAVAFVTPVYYKLSRSKPVFTTYALKTVKSNSFISHKKASEELGYIPRPIRETIEDNIKWFKENNYF